MGWTTPTDRAASYTVTNTDWNVVEDDLTFLYGDSAWTTVPSFSGTWTAGSTAPAYILLGRVVYLRGFVTGGTINTAAFTLPVGYRPSAVHWWSNQFNGAFGYGSISTAGVVTPTAGSGTNTVIATSFPVV